VIPLFVFNVKLPEAFNIPDPPLLNIILSASVDPGTAPKALSPATLNVPAEICCYLNEY